MPLCPDAPSSKLAATYFFSKLVWLDPAPTFKHPGVGEPPQMLIGLAVVRTFGVVSPGDDGRLVEQIDLHIPNREHGRFELRVFDVRQELVPIADFPIVFRIDESRGDQPFQRMPVAIDLRLVPHVLKHKQSLLHG